MKYYLYNSKANNGIKPDIAGAVELIDAVGLDYKDYFSKLSPEDEVVLVGGDGTLNYFINAMRGTEIKNNVYLYGSGTGNDFLTDIGAEMGKEVLEEHNFLVKITEIIGLTIESDGPKSSIGDLCYIYPDENSKPVNAEVVGFKDNIIQLMPLGDMEGLKPGSIVISTGSPMKIQVGHELLGRVLNGLGKPIDANIEIKSNKYDFIALTRDTHFDNYLETLEGKNLPVKHCVHNTDGWKIRKEIYDAVEDSKIQHKVFEKKTFGSFSLPHELDIFENEIQSITITGLCTDICVVTNALMLRAQFVNTPIYYVENAMYATSEDNQQATIKVLNACQIYEKEGK